MTDGNGGFMTRAGLIARMAIFLLMPALVMARLPITYDLRDVGGSNYVTSVKDQQGGTCWTHGAMASIEGNLLMTGNWAAAGDTGEPNLAEYHLDWWNGFNEHNNDDIDPPSGSGLQVHYGGDYLVTSAYLSRCEGAVRDIDGQMYNYPPPRYKDDFHIYYVRDIEWYTVGEDLSNMDLIKNKLISEGAIGTALCYGSEFISEYIHYQPPDDINEPNHAVVIVGWDDTLVTGAPLPGAWLCKNSWGEDWGYGGYFWISYYDKCCCRHPEMGAVSFQNVELLSYDNIYYHDYHGRRDTKAEYSEAFNAFISKDMPEGAEFIEAVSLYTAADSVSYTIEVYDRYAGGELLDQLGSKTGAIPHNGFHTIELDEKVELKSNDDFYIYLYLSDGGQAFDRTSDIPVLLGAKYRTIVESSAQPGESYYRYGGEWHDFYYDGDTSVNFCIKALSTEELLLNIGFPGGLPESLEPHTANSFTVRIQDVAHSYVPGTGTLHYRYAGGSYLTSSLSPLGGDMYEATLPLAGCGAVPEFYISAESNGGAIVLDPPDAPNRVFTAVVGTLTGVMEDNFETDRGWTVSGNASAGHWERGVPAGGQWGDPAADFDGSGQCYVTGNAPEASDVDDGYTYLTSPSIDLSDCNAALVSFAIWYTNHVGGPSNDVFRIYASDDNGAGWVLMETMDLNTVPEWSEGLFNVGDFVDLNDQFRVRFEASDLELASIIEAAVDAFKVDKYFCVSGVQIITEELPAWTAGLPYMQQLECAGGSGSIVWTDKFGDLGGTGLILTETGELSGTPDPGSVSFTAVATDDILDTDERLFSFEVNPAPVIVTDSVPPGLAGEPYSYQLLATGGTGIKHWLDKNSDLEGTGFSLSNAGVLSGTASDFATIVFTARVEDSPGAIDEKTFNFSIKVDFLCGDADRNQSVNMLDITYLIGYLYKEGAAPYPLEAGDVNDDLSVNMLDILSLIAYLYKSGPEPVCPR
jgi:C1A family cysteine protease